MIEAFCDVGKEDTVPPAFRKWAAISAIAGAMGRRVWLSVDRNVTLYPSMLVVLIGEVGVGKGSSMTLPYYECFMRLSTSLWADKKEKEQGHHTAYGLDWPLSMYTGRISPEKLIDGMCASTHTYFDVEPPVTESSVSLVTDEIGVLMRSFTEGFRNLFTDAWDSRPEHTHSMRTGGVVIVKAPTINWLVGATPSTFLEHFPRDSKEQGLLSRTIPIFYGGSTQEGTGLGFLKKSGTDDAQVNFLTKDLAKVAMMRGPMTVESEALAFEIDKDCRYGYEPLPRDPVMLEYSRRRAAHTMKLAMVISAAKGSSRVITAEDWKEAKDTMIEAEKAMPMVLRLFGMAEAGKIAFDLHKSLCDKGSMPLTEFKRKLLVAVKNAGELSSLFQAMVDCDMISVSGQTVKAKVV